MALMDLLAAFGNSYGTRWRGLTSPSLSLPTIDREPSEPADSAGCSKAAADCLAPSVPAADSDVYEFRRQARLDYAMTLQFDLATMTRTVQQMADGEAVAAEQYAAAGFGLKADIRVDGYQSIQDTAGAGAAALTRRSFAQTSRTSAVTIGARRIAVQAFHREASEVRRRLDVRLQDGHRIATNRLAMRYQLDDRFAFVNLSRFNAQTVKVAQEAPQSAGAYLDSTGQLSEDGTAGMMAAFFDSVDAYLDQSEAAASAQAATFFDTAAAELGFSGALVDTARSQLLSTIDRFFDRVDAAMAQLESRYVPSSQPTPTSSLLAGYTEPALARERAVLATA